MGRAVQIRGVGSQPSRRPVRSRRAEAPLTGLFPDLDPALVAGSLLSLLILLLSYDSVCGEKQSGTLRLIRSFPVSSGSLLFSKFAGILLPASAAFLIPSLLGIGLLQLHPDVALDAGAWVRVGLIVFSTLVYFGALVCMGLLASTLARSPAVSFALLLVSWTTSVFVLPSLGPVVAGWMEPPPSWAAQLESLAQIRRDLSNEQQRRLREWQQGFVEGTNEDHWATPQGRAAFYLARESIGEETDAAYEAREQELKSLHRNRYQAWVAEGRGLSRLSPSFAYRNALIQFTGTGLRAHDRFEDAVLDHVSLKSNWGRRRFTEDQLRRWSQDIYGAFDWDVADLPRFQYRFRWGDEEISEGLTDIAVLSLWGGIFFAGAFIRTRRYDPR